jgi:RNA-directed DNA polymerase
MFDELFSIYNIFESWKTFKLGKTRKKDIIYFEYHLEDNIFSLHEDIHKFKYKHSKYEYFQVFDNKKRDIYKADVRDRIVHQIIYKYLTNLYEPIFISDSYSSRNYKGHHRAIKTLRYFIKLARTDGNCFVLKCDIRKYFNNIDHNILLGIIKQKVICDKTFAIIEEVIRSFNDGGESMKSVPLGNITSQIFANIYLHNLDLYIKKELGCRFYIRYNDDFVIISNNFKKLEEVRAKIMEFVSKELKLEIPIEKTSIRNALRGIDFLGYVVLPKAVLLRNKTKGKMFSKICSENIDSYFGMLKHCNSYNLKKKILSKIQNENGIFSEFYDEF